MWVSKHVYYGDGALIINYTHHIKLIYSLTLSSNNLTMYVYEVFNM